MKTILSIIGAIFVIIVACMLYLVKTGVAMRSAPYIKPTTIHENVEVIAEHLVLRLFPDLQNVQYVLWGLDMTQEDQQRVLAGAQKQYELRFPHKVKMLNAETASLQDVQNCSMPCWVLFPQDGAHQLATNSFVEEKLKGLTESYISISWIDFENPQDIPTECIDQKYLDLHCMKWVGLKEAQRRFKDEGQRYFFLRKYLDHDYFLYVRKSAQK